MTQKERQQWSRLCSRGPGLSIHLLNVMRRQWLLFGKKRDCVGGVFMRADNKFAPQCVLEHSDQIREDE